VIGVLHAYSRANAGDGLLVDLTLERLARHGVTSDDVLLVALDPDSFPELRHRVAAGTPGRALDRRALRAAGQGAGLLVSAAGRRPRTALASRLAACTAFLAVGGGYLRTPDLTSSLGTALNHVPQLAVAGRMDRPSLYLPQSVGPLRGPVGRLVRRLLGGVGQVCVRDDRSAAELTGLAAVRRVPDLAVLHLAERAPAPATRTEATTVALVGRSLDHLPDAAARLGVLAATLPGPVVYAVQAAGDARKSDAEFYARHALPQAGRLSDLLAAGTVDTVVSVRLHGALMAILAGVPAVHLAYDRKGPAAFADLGLGEWCVDVRTAEPLAVAKLVESLRADPSPYWASLEATRPSLLADSSALDAAVARLLGG
jgi:polysaccharide pyruvyl transferase WcaK-like protein